jgi:hypothetical protein
MGAATDPSAIDRIGQYQPAIVIFNKGRRARAWSSEVDTGSHEENAPKRESRVSALIQSEPIML